jgi:LysR family hca operon transcriptional activator
MVMELRHLRYFVAVVEEGSLTTAISLVASTRGLALMPSYAKNLLPWSAVSRPLEGDAPTIDLAVGFSKANTSPILKLFLSRLPELRAPMPEKN